MLSEWRRVKLDDILEITSSKRIFRSDYCDTGIPFYRSKEVIERSKGNNISTELYISEEKFNEIKSKHGAPKAGDILLTSVGTLGVSYLVKDTDEFYFKDGNLTWFRNYSQEILPQFLNFWLRSNIAKNAIDEITIGSTQQALTIVSLKSLQMDLPNINTQKAIAHILGSLDDKIELNRKMNETLEAMAQAMFKSWFVDFYPVIDNALAAGNTIPEELAERAEQRKALGDKRKKLPPEIQKLFPSEFIFTDELGWIPKGWGTKTVGDLVDTISKTYPLKSVSKVIFLNTGDIKEGKFLHNSKSDASSLPGQAKKSIQKGDILYSEIRPQNKRFAFVHFDSSEYVVSTKLMVLRSKGEVDSLFTYFILKQQDKIDYLQMMAESRSGTFPQITFDVLSKIQVVMPEANILNDFVELLLRPIFEKSLSKDKENETLSKLRDTLLPKLLSGELRIKEAEKLVEDAL